MLVKNFYLCNRHHHLDLNFVLDSAAAGVFMVAFSSLPQQSTPEARGNLPLVNGAWPYRPVSSATNVLQLAAPLTSPLTVNQVKLLAGIHNVGSCLLMSKIARAAACLKFAVANA
jgi:hypothetical protein